MLLKCVPFVLKGVSWDALDSKAIDALAGDKLAPMFAVRHLSAAWKIHLKTKTRRLGLPNLRVGENLHVVR